MKDTKNLKPGDSVTYIPDVGDSEKGVVKSIQSDTNVFVVYHCGGEWHRYEEYTAANTHVRNLKEGW